MSVLRFAGMALIVVGLSLAAASMGFADNLQCLSQTDCCTAIPGLCRNVGGPFNCFNPARGKYNQTEDFAWPVGACDDGGTGCAWGENVTCCAHGYYFKTFDFEMCDNETCDLGTSTTNGCTG